MKWILAFMVSGTKSKLRIPWLETLKQHGFGSIKLLLHTNITNIQEYQVCSWNQQCRNQRWLVFLLCSGAEICLNECQKQCWQSTMHWVVYFLLVISCQAWAIRRHSSARLSGLVAAAAEVKIMRICWAAMKNKQDSDALVTVWTHHNSVSSFFKKELLMLDAFGPRGKTPGVCC